MGRQQEMWAFEFFIESTGRLGEEPFEGGLCGSVEKAYGVSKQKRWQL